RGDLADPGITGSWAGAFGHTQFMPSTYQRIAVDFDGDGRRDLVGSIPDALGSTAHYLARAGWRPGEPWGYEVALPAGFDARKAGRTQRRPLSEWVAAGVRRVDGGPFAGVAPDARAAVLLPAGARGPAFVVFRNFDAIHSYNAAESYALAIAHLADRLRGGGPVVTPWPTDDPGIGRAERRELQQLLLARGHAIGEADGMVGTLTRRAIAAEQARLGLGPADGRAGRRILEALRAEAGPLAERAGRRRWRASPRSCWGRAPRRLRPARPPRPRPARRRPSPTRSARTASPATCARWPRTRSRAARRPRRAKRRRWPTSARSSRRPACSPPGTAAAGPRPWRWSGSRSVARWRPRSARAVPRGPSPTARTSRWKRCTRTVPWPWKGCRWCGPATA